VLHHAEAGHRREALAKLAQRLAITLEELVEQPASARVRQGPEHGFHGWRIGDQIVTCQALSSGALGDGPPELASPEHDGAYAQDGQDQHAFGHARIAEIGQEDVACRVNRVEEGIHRSDVL